MSQSAVDKALLQLVACGVGLKPEGEMPELSAGGWSALFALSEQLGVNGIAFDGVKRLSAAPGTGRLLPADPKLELRKLQWMGNAMRMEQQNAHMWQVAQKLDKWWSAAGIHALVLKGRSVAQYYPQPDHRFSCDIDVWIGEEWEQACRILGQHGIELCHEVYKEVEFTVDGVYVECHRYITPVRGNKTLQAFERYLRSLLAADGSDGFPNSRDPEIPNSRDPELQNSRDPFFEGTTLLNPPFMFTVMLFVEHALWDFLHGKLLLKHVADWCVLRRELKGKNLRMDHPDGQPAKPVAEFERRCKEFGFDRFAPLIDAMADVVEGKAAPEALPESWQAAMADVLHPQAVEKSGPKSWFRRRVDLFCDIVGNGRRYSEFGYCSMPRFLFSSVWAHFFDKDVEL